MASGEDKGANRRRRRRMYPVTIDAILEATARQYGTSADTYCGYRSRAAGRDVAAMLCRRWTTATLRELSARFGLSHPDSASDLVKRGNRLAESSRDVARQVLEMEERGGAQARVESVEVLEAGEIESAEAGFSVRAVWTVGGMVTHFGHRHFRQNRYDARIGVVPKSGTWKIQAIEVLEQERVR